MSIFSSNAQFGDDMASGFNSWMPGGSFGATARGAQSGMNQLGQSLRQSIGSWMPRSGTNAGGWGNGAGPQFGQNDFTLNDNGDSYAPFGARSGGGGFSDNRYSSAYNQLGQLQNDIQNGRDGNSGQALDYFGRQEKQQKISELYKNTMNFDGETQRQLAQVQDELAKRKAQEDLRNPRLYNGVANTNEMLQNEARAKWGVGASQTYADGGRIGWGAGNQQGENLREAARRGVPVSNMLQDKGDFDAKVFDQSQSIYNPAAGSAADPFTWLGRSSYNTMGIGANNTSDVAYGAGGVWNPAQWGSHFEEGGGYDAQGGGNAQWNKFHKNNLSFGGGNFVGSSPEQDANRLSWYKRPQTWGSNYSWPQGEGYWQEGGEYPRSQREFYRQQRIQEDAESQPGYRKPIYDTGDMAGSPYRQIRSGISDIGFGGAVGSGVLSTGNDVFEAGDYGQSSAPAPRMSEYQRMRSPYRNMADGFDNGYYNALNDSSFGRGNYRPQSFWRTR